MKQHVKFIIPAVILLVCVAAWMLSRRAAPDDSMPSTERSLASSKAPATAHTTEKSRDEKNSPTLQSRSRLTRHLPEQWNDFILPLVEVSDLSLGDALEHVRQAYREACYASREHPLDLQISIVDPSHHAVSCSIRGKSLTASIDHLAALAGLKTRRDGTHIELFRPADSREMTELGLESKPPTKLELAAILTLGSLLDAAETKKHLQDAGIIRETTTEVTESNEGSIRFRGTKEDIARIESWIAIQDEPKIQLKFTHKILTTTEPLDLPSHTLDDSELQELLRHASQQTGSALTTAPTAVAREGQDTTVEIVREVSENGETGWIGKKLQLQASRTGLKLVGRDQSEFRPEAEDLAQTSWHTDSEVVIPSGSHSIERVSARKGEYQYRIVGMTTIDATGRPFGVEFADVQTPPSSTPHLTESTGEVPPVAVAVTGSTGMVFSPFNQKIVDVRDIPSGTLVQDPGYPAGERKYFRVP